MGEVISKKHIALWGGWYGSHNVGDKALLITITQMLHSMLDEVRFTVFTDNPKQVLAYGPQESGCEIYALENKRQFHRLVQTLATCDLFIINAVPFYQQPYHLLVIGTLVSLARFFGTPYITWSVAGQRIDSKTAKKGFSVGGRWGRGAHLS